MEKPMMTINHLLRLLLPLLPLLAACTDDLAISPDSQPAAFDQLADYDGPLQVSIALAGDTAASTRATHTWTMKADDYFGDGTASHPFPKGQFSDGDAIGIVHVVSEEGTGTKLAMLHYKATLTVDDDGTVTGVTIEGQGGVTGGLRHYAGHDNYYYAYYPFSDYPSITDNGTCVMMLNSEDEAPLVTGETTADDFFAPMITAHLTSHDDQSSVDKFLAADLLTGKGVGTMNITDGTATLTLTMNHQMAMRIVRLAKWNGFVNVYGSYDTWVSPNQTIWRMKQRLEPVAKKVCEPRWPVETPLADNHYLRRVVNSEGNIADTENDDSDQCRYFFKLVRPGTGTAEGSPIGHQVPAKDGGWLLDIPPVPASQYVMVKPLYYHWFRPLATDYDKVVALTAPLTIKQAAEAAWNNADEVTDEWEQADYKTLPDTWTYEETLFPYTDNDTDRQQYDEILEVGDLLTNDGNIIKGPDAVYGGPTDGTAVGRVMWIAWGCWEYINDDSSMDEDKGSGNSSVKRYFWNDDGSLYGWLRVKTSSLTWQTGVGYENYASTKTSIMNLEAFTTLYAGTGPMSGQYRLGNRRYNWSCEADGLRHDNGYRAKGVEQEDYETKHFVVDYANAKYGALPSLDDYWDHEVCNHFLVFALSDEDVTRAVAYNDPAIFQSPMTKDDCAYKKGDEWWPYLAHAKFLTYKSYSNTGNMLRSVVKASTNTAVLPWMVPTIPQYEVALNQYLEYDYSATTDPIHIIGQDGVAHTAFFTGALLSSSYLEESGEGLVLACNTLAKDAYYKLYMGTWDGEPHYFKYRRFFEYSKKYKNKTSYFIHVPIRKSDNKLPIWDGDSGEKTYEPPKKYRPCIAY